MNDAERVTLREFILVQLEAVEGRLNAYITFHSEQLRRTEKDLERRLEAMNEFRAQLTGQAQTFVTREYYETRQEGFEKRLRLIERGWWMVLGGAAVISAMIQIVIRLVWR